MSSYRIPARVLALKPYWKAIALGLVLAVVVPSSLLVASSVRGLPDQAAISRIGEMAQATGIYDDRDQLTFTIYKEQRIEVPLTEISPNLIHAIVAIEDQRFYEHRGYDLIRI